MRLRVIERVEVPAVFVGGGVETAENVLHPLGDPHLHAARRDVVHREAVRGGRLVECPLGDLVGFGLEAAYLVDAYLGEPEVVAAVERGTVRVASSGGNAP